jgi:SNF2 family DNA or RNA helicase
MLMLNAGVDTSCKTAFVMSLLAELVAKGHRTLIFSQSRVMLDILQAAIVEQSYAFRRIDGSISSAAERQVSAYTCMPAVRSLAGRLVPYNASNQVAVW